MAKINFNLKTPSKENSLILMRCSLPKGRLTYSTGESIPTKFWDSDNMCIITKGYSDGEEQQFRLNDIKQAVSKVLRYFYRKEITPSVAGFRSALVRELKGDKESTQSLNSFINKFIETREKSRDFRPMSIKVYKTMRNHLFKYSGNRNVLFEDLSVDFVLDFIQYLRKKKYSDNHVHKIISTLRTVLNEATEQGIKHPMPHKSKRIRVRRREADNIYLTEEEIQAICKLDLSSKSELEHTRDLFVIGCYTGLRYSDYRSLLPENLSTLNNGGRAFRVISYKTSDIIWIPVHPVVQNNLDKYDGDLPTGVVNQVMNRQLKDIAKEAGLDSLYQKRIFRGNTAEIVTKKRYEMVSTHTARRSFATNAYKAKIPVPSIMVITGHRQVETFMKYISLSKQEHAELMSENPFFQ